MFDNIRDTTRTRGSTSVEKFASVMSVPEYCKPEIYVAFMSDMSEVDLKRTPMLTPYAEAAIKTVLGLDVNIDNLHDTVVSDGHAGKWFAINCAHTELKNMHLTSPYFGARLFVEMIRSGMYMCRKDTTI